MKKKFKVNAGRLLMVLLAVLMVVQLAPTTVALADNANVEIATSISYGGGSGSKDAIPAGEIFNMNVTYTFRPLSGGAYYSSPTIQVVLPPGVEVKEIITQGNTDINYQSGVNPSIAEIPGTGVRIVNFQLDSLNPGSQKQVTIACYYPNMTTPNGTTGTFDATISGTYGSTHFELQSQQNVTIVAKDPWINLKSVESITGTEAAATHYTVTYKLTSRTESDLYDRVGRLNFTAYSVVDTFPTNYPTGGGAILDSVKMMDPATNTLVPLNNGTDYVVTNNGDGSVGKIQFNKYATMPANANPTLVPVGAPVKTEYYVTVKYLKTAFQTPTNQDIISYALRDVAALNYTLVGNVTGSSSAEATVTFGEWEPKKTPWPIEFTKKVKVGDVSMTLDSSAQLAYGGAQFILYSDAACTKVARDIDNQSVQASAKAVDANGKIKYTNLREGVYYLKETNPPAGFKLEGGIGGVNVVKIEITSTGKVKVNDGAVQEPNAVVLTNVSDNSGKGIIEIVKKGIDAVGNVSVMDGVNFNLYTSAGVLVPNKSGTTSSEGYLAIHAVDPGEYYLQEASPLPAKWTNLGFTIPNPAPKIPVTVTANSVVRATTNTPGYPDTVMNLSPYGKFQLNKIDADKTGGEKALAGSKFSLYDSTKTSTINVNGVNYEEFSVPASGFTSGFLTPGTYYLKETVAPTGYELRTDWIEVTVSANNVVTVKVEDKKLSALGVLKYGAWGTENYFTGISGATFKIYNADTGATNVKGTGTALKIGGQDVVLTSQLDAFGQPTCYATGGAMNIAMSVVNAGTYYLEEISTGSTAYDLPTTRFGPIVVDPGKQVEYKVSNSTNYGKIELVKQDSSNASKKLKDVVFGIYKESARTTQIGTMTTDANGKAVSPLLAPGAYILKELPPLPDGYVPLSGPILSIVSGGGNVGSTDEPTLANREKIIVTEKGTTQIVVKNDPLTGIRITKKDAEKYSGADRLLVGAEFKLYSANPDGKTDAEMQAGGFIVATGRTNAQGQVTFSGLTPGSPYWYRETGWPTSPAGYDNQALNPLPTKAVQVTAPSGSTTTIDEVVTNVTYGSLRVQKVGIFDGSEKNLQGGQFILYPRTSASSTASDDKAAATTAGTLKTLPLTDNAGIATYASLVPGKYWLEETVAPNGFTLPTPAVKEIEIKSGQNTANYAAVTEKITDVANKGKFSLKKVNAKDESKAVIAHFNIYKETSPGSGTYATTPTATLDTDSNGLATSDFLEPGKYKVVETSVNGNYTMDPTPKYVTIVAGQTVTAMTLDGGAATDNIFRNMPKGRIKISKTATWLGGMNGAEGYSYYVGGAVFEIYPKTSGGNSTSDRAAADSAVPKTLQTVTTANDTGIVFSDYVPVGDYWVHEISAPTGYKLDDTYYTVTVVAGSSDPALNVTTHDAKNTPEKGRIQIIKRDKANEALLDGARFEVYEVVATGGTQYTFPTIGKDGKPTGGNTTVRLAQVTAQTTLESGTVTGEHGTALTIQLDPAKTYYVREILTGPLQTRDGYQREYEWFGPLTFDPAHPETLVTQTVYNFKPTNAGGTKTDQAGGGVPGAYIVLFNNLADAQAYQAQVATTPATAADLANTTAGNAYKATWKIQQVVQSGANGLFQFTGLTPSRTYYLIEAIAPSGYVRDTGIFTMTLDNAGKAQETIKIQNISYGKIRLYKIVKLDVNGTQTTYPLDGAKFEIYNAVLKSGQSAETLTGVQGHICDGTCHYQKGASTGVTATTGTDGAGYFLSAQLPPGDYIVVETSAPDGFTKTANEYHVYVAPGTTNTYLVTNPVENTATWGRFELHKTSSLSSSTYLSAEFQLQYWDTGSSTWKDYPIASYKGATAARTFATTAGAKYVSEYLPPGRYQIIEKSVTGNYTLDATPVEFMIEAGKVTLNVKKQNVPKGGLTFTKYSKFNDETPMGTLVGVTFGLFKVVADDAVADTTGTPAYTADSGSGGAVSFTGVDSGQYWLKEMSVGSGNPQYTASFVTRKVAITANSTLNLNTNPADNVVNVPEYGKLRVKKVDSVDTTKGLAGAVFAVYRLSQYNTTTKVFTGSPVTTITTGADGVGVSVLLNPADKYVLKETTAPAGYIWLEGGIYDNGGSGYTVVKNKYNDGVIDYLVIANEKPQTVIVKKTSSDSGHPPMAGVIFDLFKADPTGVTGSALDAIRIDTQTTDATGTATFQNLQPDKDYWIREVSLVDGYVDMRDQAVLVHTDATGSKTVAFENQRKSRIVISKQAAWTMNGELTSIPVEGVKFDIYRVNASQQIVDGAGNVWDGQASTLAGFLVQSITTDINGRAETTWMAPGDYVLIEDATSLQGDFEVSGTGKYYVTVLPDETNTQYEQNPIINVAKKGRFQLEKYAIQDDSSKKMLAGAQFKAYYWENGDWVLINMGDHDSFTIPENGIYLSPYIKTGKYKLVEIKAPTGYTLPTGAAAEVEVDVELAKTAVAGMANNAKASIELTKTMDTLNGNSPLKGAKFELYRGSVAPANKVGVEMTANDFGKIVWEDLDAGEYWIHETYAPEGFAQIVTDTKVTVFAQGTAKVYPVGLTNTSQMGRLLVQKVDAANKPLQGAVFQIYNADVQNQNAQPTGSPIGSTMTSDASGLAMSPLLDAALGGTWYVVKEIQAPAGYMLNNDLQPLAKAVLVMPLQHPTATSTTNFVSFINVKDGELEGFPEDINKTVKPDGGTVDPLSPDSITAPDSLMHKDVKVTFGLNGYATGTNPLPYTSFSITDTNILMQYIESGTSNYATKVRQAGDYTIDKIKVFGARNAAGGQINATVQYQTFAQLGTDNWTSLGGSDAILYNLQNLQTGATLGYVTVDLTGKNAMAFRVNYSGTGKYFTADGIDFDVTFYKMEGGATVHEIRRIENKGELEFTYDLPDSEGNVSPVTVTDESNPVEVLVPLQNANMTRVQLETYVMDNKTYYPNNVAEIRTVATNISPDVPFISPIINVDMPAYMFLKDADKPDCITVTYFNKATGQTTEIPIDQYVSDINGHTAALEYNPDTDTWDHIMDPQLLTPMSTRRMTFAFPDITMQPGDEIMISYNGIISTRLPRTMNKLTAISQLSSAYRFPVTVENPLGISFDTSVLNGELKPFPSIDDRADELYQGIGRTGPGANEYIQETDQINTASPEELYVKKEIKGPLDSTFLDPGVASYTYPSGDLSYRLSLTNYSPMDVTTLRFIDILPFQDDSYVVRQSGTGIANARSTEIPGRATLLDVDTSTLPAGVTATVYYYTGPVTDWNISNRQQTTVTGELPMLYFQRESAWTERAGWTDQKPSDMSTVTAVGIEVDFPHTKLLKQDDSVSVVLNMKTPAFTIDQVGQFYDKMMANSVGASVIYDGHKNPLNHNAPMEVPIENHEVISYMRLPMGTIGDYVWWDKNNDGLQDDTDEPLVNVPVTLNQVTYYADGQESTTIYHTKTDAAGKYLFEKLPCNLLIEGRDADSKDPNDYIGGVYYEYQLVFGDPSTSETKYSPTFQNFGTDDTIDSDIDGNRTINGITLDISVDKATGNMTGETNLTLDAGFVIGCQLGDRVWRDHNKDGIQGPDEEGVNGVTVNLYRVINGVVQDTPYRTTLTQNMLDESGNLADGIYMFTDLPPGTYVVEFDISKLVKDDGYTYSYAFSPARKGDISSVDDSDAETTMDQDDRVRRARPVTLKAGDSDRTWDAGLTTYSAIGGYCFDDRNYNDIQDIGIALPGSIVTLYKYNDDGSLNPTPVRQVTVGEDGTYFFDLLDEGEYAVHVKFPDKYIAVDPNVGNSTIDSDISTNLTPDRNEGYTIRIDLKDDEVQLHWDAGAYLLGGLGDYVWFDTNKDGIQDANEPPVAGVKVTLQRRLGPDGIWEYQEDTLTDAKGWYWFDELECGLDANWQYRVLFLPDEMSEMTICNAGADMAKDSDALPVFIDGLGYPTVAILLGYGQEDPTWDAGLIGVTSALGDYVWYDNNQNGVQDSTEPGVENVRCVLEYNVAGDVGEAASWMYQSEQMTNRSGFYRFYDLREGYYRVTFYMPETYTVTSLENATGENGYEIDSDAITPGQQDKYVTRSIYLPRETTDWTWDGGIFLEEETPTPTPKTTYKPGPTVTRTTTNPGGTVYRYGANSTVGGGTVVRDSVRTGDDSMLWLWIAIAGAAGAAVIIAMVVIGKRKKAYNGRR